MEGSLSKKDLDMYIKHAIGHGRPVMFCPACELGKEEDWRNTDDENKSYVVIINPSFGINPFGEKGNNKGEA